MFKVLKFALPLLVIPLFGLFALFTDAQTYTRDPTIPLDTQISSIPESERPHFKSQLLNNIITSGTYLEKGIEIEIQEVNLLSGGIEVFVSAIDVNGSVAFGDGTVEIERFLIWNPPVLVSDPSGNIVRAYVDLAGEDQQLRYREDPLQALINVLHHVITLVGENNSNIIEGKIGSTHSVYFPIPTVFYDGFAFNSDPTWASTHDAASSDTIDDTDVLLFSGSLKQTNFGIWRAGVLFDTSNLTGENIFDAVISLWTIAKNNADNDGNDFISVVETTTVNDNVMHLNDFGLQTTTEIHNAGERKDITDDVPLSQYIDFQFNALGTSTIIQTGVSKFGIREGHDLLDDPINDPTASQFVSFSASDVSGTSEDPMLVVEHSSPVIPPSVSTSTPVAVDVDSIVVMLGFLLFGMFFFGFLEYFRKPDRV